LLEAVVKEIKRPEHAPPDSQDKPPGEDDDAFEEKYQVKKIIKI